MHGAERWNSCARQLEPARTLSLLALIWCRRCSVWATLALLGSRLAFNACGWYADMPLSAVAGRASGIFWEFWFLVIFVSGVGFILITLAPKFVSAETTSCSCSKPCWGRWIWGLLGQRPEGMKAGGAVVAVIVVVVRRGEVDL